MPPNGSSFPRTRFAISFNVSKYSAIVNIQDIQLIMETSSITRTSRVFHRLNCAVRDLSIWINAPIGASPSPMPANACKDVPLIEKAARPVEASNCKEV